MKIILSPAKKMKTDTDSIGILSCPVFMEKTEEILSWLKGRTEEELQKMWKCNDNIAAQNIERINSMNLYKQLTPAVLGGIKTDGWYYTISTRNAGKGFNRAL